MNGMNDYWMNEWSEWTEWTDCPSSAHAVWMSDCGAVFISLRLNEYIAISCSMRREKRRRRRTRTRGGEEHVSFSIHSVIVEYLFE